MPVPLPPLNRFWEQALFTTHYWVKKESLIVLKSETVGGEISGFLSAADFFLLPQHTDPIFQEYRAKLFILLC
jgi:hypothetical protein